MSFFSIAIFITVIIYLWKLLFSRDFTKYNKLTNLLFYIFLFLLIHINVNNFTLENLVQSTKSQISFILTVAMISILILLKLKSQLLHKKRNKVVLVILILFTLVYVEYFNGIYSFNNHHEFRKHLYEIKKHQKVFPIKLVSSQKDYNIVDDSQFNVYIYPSIYGTPFKVLDGRYYYYTLGGFGKLGNWWEYGIPIGSQI